MSQITRKVFLNVKRWPFKMKMMFVAALTTLVYMQINRNEYTSGEKIPPKSKDSSFIGESPLTRYLEETEANVATHWNEGWDTWLTEQRRRKEVIKNKCNAIGQGLSQREKYLRLLKIPHKLSHLLVDDRHKTVYCYIPKAGCSNWKRMWMILRGNSNATAVDEIPSKKAHMYTSKMKLARNTSSDEVLQKLQNYTKVIVVRHPIERLLSAYLNKIHGPEGRIDFQLQVYPFVKGHRMNANLTNIEWPEFISFITHPGGSLNEHWIRYNSLCHPCDLEYDIIVKFESIDEDSERFLRLIEAPEQLHFPSQGKRVNASHVNYYMENLSQTQKESLIKKFRIDFDLFEYDIPS